MAQAVKAASAPRPTHVRYVVLGLDGGRLHDHVHGPAGACDVPARDQKELGISLTAMGWITFGFRMAYALFQIPGGWLGDTHRRAARPDHVVSWWSAFTALTAHRLERGLMFVIQVFFGVGEAGAFPIATRSLSRWMRPTERGFARASRMPVRVWAAPSRRRSWYFHHPASSGGAPHFLHSACSASCGPRHGSPTIATHRRNITGVNQAERELMRRWRSARPGKVPWRKILSHGNLWVLAVMYFFYNYNLNVYKDWFPTYLQQSRDMTLARWEFMPVFRCWPDDRRSRRRMVLRCRSAARRKREPGAALGGDRGIPPVGGRDGPRGADPRPRVSVAWYCVAFFGLEWTVGISWAVPLDIGGDFAGSVSAVHEHAGQYRGRRRGDRGHLYRGALRLECAISDDRQFVPGRGSVVAEDRRRPAN